MRWLGPITLVARVTVYVACGLIPLPVAALIWLMSWSVYSARPGYLDRLDSMLQVTCIASVVVSIMALPLLSFSFAWAQRRVMTVRALAWLIYACWVFPTLGALFLILGSVGGVSMAVVEGAVSSVQFHRTVLTYTLGLTALLQLGLLPGVYCAVKLLQLSATRWRASNAVPLRAQRNGTTAAARVS